MKTFKHILFTVVALATATVLVSTAAHADQAKSFEQPKSLKIAVVDFKTCVEKSKLGKQEQSAFDALKKQMETILEEKEKTLNDMADKLNDIDYLDSLSPEAETELKRKFRALGQELSQQQTQYYQALSQTNVKVIQKITDYITAASKEVAKKFKIDLVVNEDGSFYTNPDLDISMHVVQAMDEAFDKEANENKDNKPSALIP